MKRKPIRLARRCRGDRRRGVRGRRSRAAATARRAAVDMHHGKVKFAKGQETTILNAVDTRTSERANDQLVAKGRKMFRDPSLFMNGETCQTCHAEGAASAELGTMTHDSKRRASPVPGLAGMSGLQRPARPPGPLGPREDARRTSGTAASGRSTPRSAPRSTAT